MSNATPQQRTAIANSMLEMRANSMRNRIENFTALSINMELTEDEFLALIRKEFIKINLDTIKNDL